MKDKILLIFPGRCGVKDVNLPLSLLFIAKPLLEKSYKPEILDCRLQDYKTSLKNLNEYICVGITSMSGEQVKHALEISAWLKKRNSDLKIVWGGPHGSSLPEQTVENENVDIVVKGEGEEAFIEILSAIKSKKGFRDIQGIAFKDKNKIISTPRRKLRDINKSAGLPYHLIDMSKYPVHDKFEYISSKGCPHRCGFCSNEINYCRRWIGKTPKVMIDEIKEIVDKFNPGRIVFNDGNFFVDRKRVEEFCRLVIKHKLNVEFYAQVRCDYLVTYDDKFFKLLKKANFKELAFGAESGSPRILRFIEKDITVKQTLKSVHLLKKNEIRAVISLIIGLPTETDKELNKTLSLYDEIKKIDKNAMINGMFIFTPLPGTSLTKYIEDNIENVLPTKLEDWADIWKFSDKRNITWASERVKSKYEAINICVRILFINQLLDSWNHTKKKIRFGNLSTILSIILFNKLYYVLAKLRWKTRFFYFPYDLRLWQKAYSSLKGMS